MANEIMNVMESAVVTGGVEVTFKNKKLAQHTKAIEKLMLATKRNMFEIAVRLNVIATEKLYEADEYKDVFDYANKVLGYKKNFVYKLVAVAEKFIDEAADGKSYISIIAHENEDYSVSQLIELNSLEADTVSQLDASEEISPDMTTKEIREVVKAYKNGGKVEEEATEGESETDTGASESEEIDAAAVAIQNILDGLVTLQSDERFADKAEELTTFFAFINGLEL